MKERETDVVLRALHLCSGYGGFELALRLAGIDARTVGHVERDSHAAAALVARMEDQALDHAPIWSDLTTFNGRPWCGTVDLITAGFPCQPFSAAGQLRGVNDERWIWPDIARVIAEVAPQIVVLENVPGLVRAGLPHVISDLARLGFNAEWGLFAASAVGAPHRRNRFWLVAYTNIDGLRRLRMRPDQHEPDVNRPCGEALGHTRGPRRPENPGSASGVANTHGSGSPLRRHHRPRPALPRITDRGRVGEWPPRPDETNAWAVWIAGGGPEPQLRRSPDGVTGRLVKPRGLSDRLHLLGNGLVPQAGAVAIHQLVERAINTAEKAVA